MTLLKLPSLPYAQCTDEQHKNPAIRNSQGIEETVSYSEVSYSGVSYRAGFYCTIKIHIN